MTPPKFVVCLTCLLLETIARVATQKFSSHRQEARFISADVGGSLTLQCFYEQTDATRFYWYKQSLRQRLRLISMFYKFDKEATFYDNFKSNPRFTVDTEKGNNHLKITDLRTSDSATYYCASSYSFLLEFAEGTIVNVKGSGLNIRPSVQQSPSTTIHPGDSVNLSCTVQTGICDGEHSVYWFQTGEEPLPRIIYTQGGTNDQCGKKPNRQTRTCVHNLPIKNLSHAGTYYCAVASCGHIVFGNGTKLNEGKSLFLVYFLSGALTFTAALVVLLAFLLFKMSKKSRFQSESPDRFSAPSTEDADNLHYASISVKPPNRPKRQRNTESQCVYSTVKQ
uniref:Ig-like domain-containing protein n=1 Tax=Stegastes partitus TaxID=144197 RepID=A0A3B4ZUT2_9TELE